MKITVLGSGTSAGVPFILCPCKVCQSTNPRNKRLRASIWIQIRGKSLLVDTSTDLRQQALRENIDRIDAVLYTHPHADHIHGIDELRSFNYIQKSMIPVYGNAWTCEDLARKFDYIFQPKESKGGGIPQLSLHPFDPENPAFSAVGVDVIPLPLEHGDQQSVGFRVDSMAYVTDCSLIPPVSLQRMQNLEVLILDCVRLAPHHTHFSLKQALETVEKLKPRRTFLTHLGHELDYEKESTLLPQGVHFAYDGLVIESENL
jgi:phosphoribosyl 1,2-cyclic phosphate phosphodiesterase